MKLSLKLLAALFAASLTITGALAAETAPTLAATATASPAGTWKWTQQGRGGNATEQTLKLDYKEGKLTGTLVGSQGRQGPMPDVQIADASFKDGAIAFTVTREFNGNKVVSKYEGKLDGDTIKGSNERPGRNGGEPTKRDWAATRAK